MQFTLMFQALAALGREFETRLARVDGDAQL